MKKIVLVLIGIVLLGLWGWFFSSNDTENTESEVIIEHEVSVKRESSIYIVSLDESESYKENYSDNFIGCNDKLLEVVVGGEMSPREVLEELFDYSDLDFESGEYNVFNQSKTVEIVDFYIQDGVAHISLSEEFVVGGVCDTPRVTAQIEKTLLQYPEINNVKINVGEESINEYLSEKD